jgi:hypothetical protein
MKAIDTTTTTKTNRPLWGLVTDAVYRRIGDNSPSWGAISSEVRRFLRLSGLDFRPRRGRPSWTESSVQTWADWFIAVRIGTADHLPNGQKIARRRNPRVPFRKEWYNER